jgi:hypothetical protein
MHKWTFSMGGVEWEAYTSHHTGFKWKRYPGYCKIEIPDSIEEEKFDLLTLENTLWDCIIQTIVCGTLCKGKEGVYGDYVDGFSTLIRQVITQIYFYRIEDFSRESVVMIGNQYFKIRVDNVACIENDCFGRMDGGKKLILLQDTDRHGNKFTFDFMMATMLHELVHAVNYMMNLSREDWDSETVVNVLAHTIYEVMKTAKYEGD